MPRGFGGLVQQLLAGKTQAAAVGHFQAIEAPQQGRCRRAPAGRRKTC
eukprot:gene2369-2697_t